MYYFSAMKYALALGMLTLSLSASAALVTFNFSGLVTANNPSGLVFTPAIGSTFNGGFTVEDSNTSGVGSNCVATPNCWSDSATSWNWDGIHTQLGGPNTLADLFRVHFNTVDSVAGSGHDELTITMEGDLFTVAELYLTDSSGSAFESTSALLPSFGSFDSATYNYVPTCFGGVLGCAFSLRHSGDITALSPTVVPLPAAAYLFAAALGSLLMGIRTRRGKLSLPS